MPSPLRFPAPRRGTRVKALLALVALLTAGPAAADSYLACSGPPPLPAAAGLPPPDRSELLAAARAASDGPFEVLDGWLRLIDAADLLATDPEAGARALERWRDRFRDHPARALAARFPAGPRAGGPGTVLALLPLSGPLAAAGNAVRAGLTQVLGEDRIELFDTGSGALPVAAVTDAFMRLHPRLVVGPLTHEQVAQWAAREPPVTTLALNTLPDGTAQPRLLEFALRPEDEGRALADRVMLEVGNGCGVLAAGAGEQWERVAAAFRERLAALGGCVGAEEGSPAFEVRAGESAGRHRRVGDAPVYAGLRDAAADGLRLVGPPLAVGLSPAAVDDGRQLAAFGRDAGRIAIVLLADGRFTGPLTGETGTLSAESGGRIRRALTLLRTEGGRLVADCR